MALSGAKYEEKDNLAALFDIPEARIWVIAKKNPKQNKHAICIPNHPVFS